MAVSYQVRVERLDAIEKRLPAVGEKGEGVTAQWLLERLARYFEDCESTEARLRKIQRDLNDLEKDGRIVRENPKAKPLRYWRVKADQGLDPVMWAYAVRHMEDALREALPEQRLEVAMKAFHGQDGTRLGPHLLRIVPDTLRLLPAEFKPKVLEAMFRALLEGRTLRVSYRDREGKLTRPEIHPQAALQRGPRLYLYALKEDEDEPVRMYALHRFLSAEVGDAPVRRAAEFDLEAAILRGQADFAKGQRVELVARVRGYIVDLLRECPMGRDQTLDEEPDGSYFQARLFVTVPSTGQLLRWLLGCGDNVEVLEPEDLRDVLAAQCKKMAALYTDCNREVDLMRTPTGGAVPDARGPALHDAVGS